MFTLIVKGLMLGVTLSFIIGPLFFSIIESALSRGSKAGMAVASGIWASDALFIAAVVKGITALESVMALPGFRFWAGLIGSSILMLFGVVSLVGSRSPKGTPAPLPPSQKGYWPQWVKGFVINSINPGTFAFWLGTATGIVAPNAWNTEQMLWFFSAMMAVLIVTDLLKIRGARYLRTWLTPEHILMVRRGIGFVLITFGLMLALRSW